MIVRSLGGVVACLGFAGSLAAQQPAASFTLSPSQVVQTGYSSPAPHPNYKTTVRPVASQPLTVPATGNGQMLKGTMVSTAPAAADTLPKTATAPAPTTAAPAAQAATPPSATQMLTDPMSMSCSPVAGCDTCTPCVSCLCGPPGRAWVSAEWLYLTTKGQNLPPLITTAPPGTARAVGGSMGGPGTTVLYGNSTANEQFRSGFRVNAGMWLDDCQRLGIDAGFFYLPQTQQGSTVGSDGTAIVTRPFYNASTGRQDIQLVSSPGVLSGTTSVNSTTNPIYGFSPNLIKNLMCDPCNRGRLDLLIGYRYLNMGDNLNIYENLVALPGAAVPAGTQYFINDQFQTGNVFNGASVGLAFERRWSHFYFNARGAVALGVASQTVQINGSTAYMPPGGPVTNYPGGLLAQPTNIGRYSDNRFAVVPEVGLKLGVQLTEYTRAFVGYDFMYWSSVVRAGDQIDPRVNTTQLAPPRPFTGPAVPAFTPRTTDYWIQGVSLGVEFRF